MPGRPKAKFLCPRPDTALPAIHLILWRAMTADDVKRLLQLTPLELEGGFFRETYRSRWQVPAEHLPEGIGGNGRLARRSTTWSPRNLSLRLHRLPGTEVFHFYLGDPVVMLQLHPEGESRTVTLGHDLAAGHEPQVVVRGGVWQGCGLFRGWQWALLGTTMSPGFDYADYETGARDELIAQYPSVEEMIRRYTSETDPRNEYPLRQVEDDRGRCTRFESFSEIRRSSIVGEQFWLPRSL